MSDSLAPELLRKILSYAENHDGCALVSRAWNSISRELAYARIELNLMPESARLFSAVLQGNDGVPTTISTKIKAINLSDQNIYSDNEEEEEGDKTAFDQQLVLIFNHFTQIDSLTIGSFDLTKRGSDVAAALLRPSLVTNSLIIQNLTVQNVDQLIRLVRKGTSMEFLGLGNIHVHSEDAVSYLNPLPLQKLHNINIFSDTPGVWAVIPYLLSQPCAGTLKLAVFPCRDNDSLHYIQGFVHKSAETLEKLALYFLKDEVTMIDLSTSASLKVLSVDMTSSERAPAHMNFLRHTILSLPASSSPLEEISLNVGPEIVKSTSYDFSAVDSYLATPGNFSNLKRVRFTIFVDPCLQMFSPSGFFGRGKTTPLNSVFETWRKEAEEWGERMMPMCKAKGWVLGTQRWGGWTGAPFQFDSSQE